ncbi:FtsX-like permease family protein [Nocardioides perillae]|uniref:ABC3 transporter permease C-terminal domain-containing protein n=1 Tax=Nocardioides perillae TaxID=1119534 RepID=A0A7Y9RUM4_9ACTN|nr:FtsX-like permease family protein [Nocardioides perillae]NYG54260.1 hypothetical protein [Nocardioides perillae]
MRPLWRVGLDAVGRGRASLVLACTAVVSGLLLVGASIVQLSLVDRGDRGSYESGMLGVVADPSLRPGVLFGIALACLPLLLLLDQAVRLGSADRRRRVAALRVAGATRRDLGRLGAVEVGVPAVAGALLGVVVWAVLRQVLGVALLERQAALVPVTVGPGPWVPVVVGVLAAYGLLVGRRAGRRAATTDGLGEAGGPRGLARPPRPWGLLPLGVGVALLWGLATGGGAPGDDALTLLAVAAIAAGMVLLAPAVAHAVAGLVARRARGATALLASRRLQVDARPAGRAAAAVGAVALALGVVGGFVPDVWGVDSYDRGFYLAPALLAAILAAGLVAASLAVHTTETVLDRQRELATLVATGVPAAVVSRSQRLECLMATVPMALLGALLGGVGFAAMADTGLGGYVGAVVGTLVALTVVAGAVTLATALLRPWVEAALQPDALRTA